MRVVSVAVGMPRTIVWQGEPVETGIFKEPVAGRVPLGKINFEGDGQSDRVNHGGLDKAVYAYPIEHYPFWRDFLGKDDLPFGALGENLTVEGLLEEDAHIGDVLRVGTATLRIAQPRQPCYKLAARWERKDIVRAFVQSGLCGFYLSVEEEGEIGAGDAIERIHREAHGIRIPDLNDLHRGVRLDRGFVDRALALDRLPEWWRGQLTKARERAV